MSSRASNNNNTTPRGVSSHSSTSSTSFRSFAGSTSIVGKEEVLADHVQRLYKAVTKGKELPDRLVTETLSALMQEQQTYQNETKCAEKLKIHLIKQGKHSEAMKFVELYKKLKNFPSLKRKDSLMQFFHEMFDKEATRNAMNSSKIESSPQLQFQQAQAHSGLATTRKIEPLKGTRRLELGASGALISSSTAGESMPMPCLSNSRDRMLGEEIHRSQSRLPGLMHPSVPNPHVNVGRRGGSSHSSLDMESTLMQMKEEEQSFVSSSNWLNGSGINGHGRMSASVTVPNGIGSKGKESFPLNSQGTSRNNVMGIGFRKGVPAGPVNNMFSSSKQIEKELIRDLVFVFQGIDGAILKSDAKGNYEVVGNRSIQPGLKQQVLRLAELGFFYKQIKNYCEKPTVGLMAGGFKHALDLELREYLRLLALVQGQVQQNIVDTPMSDNAPSFNVGDDMTILKMTVWMFDSRPRLDAVAGIINSCDGTKGGEMCSFLYKYSLHGDPMVGTVTTALLSTTSKPLFLMICHWILYGELEDPYEEFFIGANIVHSKDKLWHGKYFIRMEMLPSFITIKEAEKILAIGKNINFLKDICNHSQGYEGRDDIMGWLEQCPVECMFMEEEKKVLTKAVELAYTTTSKMVLDVLIKESKLIDHLKAIKSYLLLGQGDFIQHLLDMIEPELQKPASKLYAHNIAAILESAVRATNAQFECEEVLSRLDHRILDASDQDLGWDVFCLDYKAAGPIGTVLTEEVMNRYNQLFNALWRTKRVEMILNKMWKDQSALFKCQRTIPEVGPVLHCSQLLISEMIHFVHQTQYYIMFEATECAWDKLMEEVGKAMDLDQVIKAHASFLEAVITRSLLSKDNRNLLNQLRGIFDSVHDLKAFLAEFEGNVNRELEKRKKLTSPDEHEAAKNNFFSKYISQARAKIDTLYTTTQDLVRTFLLVLNKQPDLTLQCLSFRLDFNEYYHFRDSRLSQPLTYQNRRLSLSSLDPSGSMSASGLMNMSFTPGPLMESFAEEEHDNTFL